MLPSIPSALRGLYRDPSWSIISIYRTIYEDSIMRVCGSHLCLYYSLPSRRYLFLVPVSRSPYRRPEAVPYFQARVSPCAVCASVHKSKCSTSSSTSTYTLATNASHSRLIQGACRGYMLLRVSILIAYSGFHLIVLKCLSPRLYSIAFQLNTSRK